MDTIKQLYAKYRGMILYVFFGGCATVVNMAAYYISYNMLGIANVPSTIIAWVAAVIFAFFSNKLWVFESKSWAKDVVLHEAWSFFAARIATGLLDVGVMYLAVDVMGWNSTLWKLISNVIVIILNYIASKFFIFKKKDGEEKQA